MKFLVKPKEIRCQITWCKLRNFIISFKIKPLSLRMGLLCSKIMIQITFKKKLKNLSKNVLIFLMMLKVKINLTHLNKLRRWIQKRSKFKLKILLFQKLLSLNQIKKVPKRNQYNLKQTIPSFNMLKKRNLNQNQFKKAKNKILQTLFNKVHIRKNHPLIKRKKLHQQNWFNKAHIPKKNHHLLRKKQKKPLKQSQFKKVLTPKSNHLLLKKRTLNQNQLKKALNKNLKRLSKILLKNNQNPKNKCKTQLKAQVGISKLKVKPKRYQKKLDIMNPKRKF